MIAFISLIYASFYFLVFGKGLVKKSARNMSIFVGLGVVMVSAIVFTWLTVAPSSKDGRVFQFVIPIVPEVSGHVIEVPAEPLVTMEKGDVLFKSILSPTRLLSIDLPQPLNKPTHRSAWHRSNWIETEPWFSAPRGHNVTSIARPRSSMGTRRP